MTPDCLVAIKERTMLQNRNTLRNFTDKQGLSSSVLKEGCAFYILVLLNVLFLSGFRVFSLTVFLLALSSPNLLHKICY